MTENTNIIGKDPSFAGRKNKTKRIEKYNRRKHTFSPMKTVNGSVHFFRGWYFFKMDSTFSRVKASTW
jgi:hypothetical protein